MVGTRFLSVGVEVCESAGEVVRKFYVEMDGTSVRFCVSLNRTTEVTTRNIYICAYMHRLVRTHTFSCSVS